MTRMIASTQVVHIHHQLNKHPDQNLKSLIKRNKFSNHQVALYSEPHHEVEMISKKKKNKKKWCKKALTIIIRSCKNRNRRQRRSIMTFHNLRILHCSEQEVIGRCQLKRKNQRQLRTQNNMSSSNSSRFILLKINIQENQITGARRSFMEKIMVPMEKLDQIKFHQLEVNLNHLAKSKQNNKKRKRRKMKIFFVLSSPL